MTDHAANLRRLLRYTSAVREVANLLPIQSLQILLLVASKPGITQGELRAATGLANASVSRNIASLSATHHEKGKEGLGLLAQVPLMSDTRALNVFLTIKGREVVRKLLQAATGASPRMTSARERSGSVVHI